MKDAHIQLLCDLISIESPYFREEKAIYFIYEWLQKEGLPASIEEYEETKITHFRGKNVIGEIKGTSEGKTILLNGHVDTVEICQGWTRDPLKASVENDRLYGLGALDMKSGVVAIMLALKEFYYKHKDFRGTIKYQFVSDEEGPFGLGSSHLIAQGVSADIIIVTEPSAGFTGIKGEMISLGARGGLAYTVEVQGLSAHAATPELGSCAITAASKIIIELDKLQRQKDDFLDTGSHCVLQFNGGGAICSVADKASFSVFRHIVRKENKKTVYQEIVQAIMNAKVNNPYTITFREAPSKATECFLPYVTDQNNPLVQEFINIVSRNTQKKPKISYFPSIGDFNYFGSLTNIPTICYGPSGANFHAPDEYVNISSLVQVTKNIIAYFEEILL